MTLPADVVALAEAQAAQDRAILAQLRREGKVQRDTSPEGAFVRDIEARAWPKRHVNLALQPKKKRRRR